MVFVGRSKTFSLENEGQYDTIGAFWDEMSLAHGMENLQGLGYRWQEGKIWYAIGLKEGEIAQANVSLTLPEDGWCVVEGRTEDLKQIYDEIYQAGPLRYEIETFTEDGMCRIAYYR